MRLIACLTISLVALCATGWNASAQPEPGDFKAGWSTWAQTRAGDWVEHRHDIGGEIVIHRLEVKAALGEGKFRLELVVCDEEGKEIRRNEVESSYSGIPAANTWITDSAWSKAEHRLGDRTLACDVATVKAEGASGEIWLSRDVPCGGLVRSRMSVVEGDSAVETGIELLGFGRDEDGAQPDTASPLEGYGDPITMPLPEKVRDAIRDQGTAITRMRLYFQEATGAEDGAKLEYEGMATEVPVIYAAFVPERCDKLLSYKDWSERTGRYVDLGFDVKTRPRTLKGLTVRIEHSHMQGDTETAIRTYDVPKPARAGDAWESLRLQGARPGINRYTLLVTYTNVRDEQTTQRGFSHWVVVDSPPMFEFFNDAAAVATATQVGGQTLLEADVRMSGSFLLHHGLRAGDCSLRITRRGKRSLNLSPLSPEVRRQVGRDAVPGGWHELGRCNLDDGTVNGRRVADVEDSFVRITWLHNLAATSRTLPLAEEWEYRFELYHRGTVGALASWSASVSVDINRPEDIAEARLKVQLTSRPEPILVAFEAKQDK